MIKYESMSFDIKTHFDVPVDYEPGGNAPDALVKRITEELAELKSQALKVTGITIGGVGHSPRYGIQFDKGTPMYQTRHSLEKLKYDVGQKLGNNQVFFYATKRTEQVEGWGV